MLFGQFRDFILTQQKALKEGSMGYMPSNCHAAVDAAFLVICEELDDLEHDVLSTMGDTDPRSESTQQQLVGAYSDIVRQFGPASSEARGLKALYSDRPYMLSEFARVDFDHKQNTGQGSSNASVQVD